MIELDTFGWIALFAFFSVIVNSLGILAIMQYRQWALKSKTYFMCFAAGLLLTAPLVLVLPNAAKTNPYAGFVALFGFLFMLLSNRLIKKYTKKRELAFGITAVEGIGIHSFIDGLVYTITFQASILIGLLAATGLVIHEFAEGVITYIFLTRSGVKKELAGIYAFLVAGLTTPIGAFLVYPFVATLEKSILGLLLGFVSGVLLYVSAAHLLPEAREQEDKKGHSIIAFMAGIGFALFLVLTKIFS